MYQTTESYPALRQQTGFVEKLAACLVPEKNKTRIDWTIEQLNIQPYQHILEIGYGPGNTLQEVARKLKIGFLAGIDESVSMYKYAYRKNKRFIGQQLMQLHIGKIHELSYPAHYFHTVYGNNIHFPRKEKVWEFLQLSSLLKSGGKMLMVFQPRWAGNEEDVKEAAEKIKLEYAEAGLINIQIEFKEMNNTTCIAATGFKA